VVVVIAIVVVSGASGGRSGRSSTSASAAQHTAPSGVRHKARPRPVRPPSAYRVGITSLALLEPAATPHTASSAPARSLPTRVRYPALGTPAVAPAPGAQPDRGHGPFPLVVFSQGFNYPAEGYAALMNAWARAGYVVADPSYPLTDPTEPDRVNEDDILHHPADLRFVISQLLNADHASSGPLHNLIDPNEIGVVGQSDGGDVSLAVAANTCCRDPRVRAAAILSGAELPAFGGRYFGAGAPPLLVIQGDQDTINAPGCSASLYDGAPAPKYYVDLLGAPHLSPYVDPGPWQSRVEQAVGAFLDLYLKHEPGGLTRLRRAAQAPGVTALSTTPALTGSGTYCPPAGIP
jgi:predicted dienelactone hydrolase